MNELQLGLLIAGALAVGGVILYNRVQERRQRRRAEQAFGSRHADVLLSTEPQRREPSLSPPPPAREEVAGMPVEEDLPDQRLDYVIELGADKSVPTAVMLEAWQSLERRFGHRTLLAYREDNGSWRRATHATVGARTRWRAALQLVSRGGVAGEAELIEFRSEIETLAAHAGANVTAPEMRQALDAARALDRACADADIQVAFHVVPADTGGFPWDAVARALRTQGFVEEGKLRWIRSDAVGRELFSATLEGDSAQGIDRLTLTMDVPRTPELRRGYESMVLVARGLASMLGGTLQDDNARALDEHSLSAIAAQLDTVREDLTRRGFSPGSTLALRLFS